MPALEIRHSIVQVGEQLIVRECFGDVGGPTRIEFTVPDRAAADALVAERRALLKDMIASLSKDAAEAVRNARTIDRIPCGHA